MDQLTSVQIAQQITEEFSDENVHKLGYHCLGVKRKRPCLPVKRIRGELCARCLLDELRKVTKYHNAKYFYEAVLDMAGRSLLIKHMIAHKNNYHSNRKWVSYYGLLHAAHREYDKHLKTRNHYIMVFEK